MSASTSKSGGRPLLMLAIILLALFVTLAAVLVLAGPRLGGAYASGLIEKAINDKTGGTSDVSLRVGWLSPTEIESLVVTGANGQTIADLRVTTELSLLDLLTFDGDAGAVTITGGSLTLDPETAGALGLGGADSPGSSSTGSDEPIDLSFLADLRGSVVIDSLAIEVRDEKGRVIGTDDLDATLALDRGSATLAVSSSEPLVDIALDASGFVGANGALDVRAGSADGHAVVNVPREDAERVARMFGLSAEMAVGERIEIASPEGETVLARFDASLDAGRLRVVSRTGPSNLPLLDPLLEMLLPMDEFEVSLRSRPSLSVSINEFAMDIFPESGGIADLSSGVLDASATVSRAIARVTDRQGDERTTQIDPVKFTFSSADLSGELAASVETSVAIDGQHTGDASASARLTRPFTDDLRFRTDSIRTAEAIARIRDIPASLLGPLERLIEGVYPEGTAPGAEELFGPRVSTLSVNITPVSGTPVDTTKINLSLLSELARVQGDLVLKESEIVGQSDRAVLINTTNPRAMLAPFLGEGLALEDAGAAAISINELSIALSDDLVPDPSRSSGTVRVALGDFGVTLPGETEPGRTRVTSLDTSVQFVAGGPANVMADYRFVRDGEVFDLFSRATVDLPRLSTDVSDLASVDFTKTTATVSAKLTGAPVSFLEVFDAELAQTARELGGETVTLTVRPSESVGGHAHSIVMETETGRLSGGAVLALSEGTMTLSDISIDGVATPEAFESLHERYADAALGEEARLGGDTPYSLTSRDIVMDMDGLLPDVSTLRDFSASIVLSEGAEFAGLPHPEREATVPISIASGARMNYHHDQLDHLNREVNGRLSLHDPGAEGRPRLAQLKLKTGLTGTAAIEINLEESDPSAMDEWLGYGGRLASAVGPDLRGRVQVIDQRVPAGRTYFAAFGNERVNVQADLIDTNEGLFARRPVQVNWTPTRDFLESRFVHEDSAGAAHRVKITEASPVTAVIETLRLGPAGKRLEPGMVEIAARAGASRFAFAIDGGDPVVFEDIRLKATPSGSLDSVDFNVIASRVVDEAPAAGSSASPGVLEADGTVLLREGGEVAVTMRASGDMPTIVVDTFANSNGAVYDLLGPTTTIDLRTNELTHASGSALVNILSSHVQGSIQGDMMPGAFHAADGARITVTRISPDFSERYVETVLPFLTRFEKTKGDDPASFVADGLTIPVDGDMAGLNGEIMVDLGTVQFQTSRMIGDILEATNNRREGSLGGRVEPFLVKMVSGVVSYDRTSIPTGKYVMETRGTIDLVKDRMEIILYLPLSALSGDLRETFAKVPGLDRVGMAPIRLKGPINKPKVEPALDLLVKEGVPETIDNVLDGLFKKGLDEALKGIK